MLDQFLEVTYRQSAEKTASAALQAKLREMPAELVEKIAMYGAVKACGPGDSGDVKCWLDNFKGTPLFNKAVELERAEIQLEQADIEQRMNAQSQDTWTKRDALRLQKKMLELDLAMDGAGGSSEEAPEQAEEQGVALLEQAQAEEEAAGKGNSPEEKMENDAIAELHAAHGEGAPPAAPAEAGGQPPPPKAPPKPPAKKEPPKEEPAEEQKQASLKVAAATAAGRILAKLAEPAPPKGMSVKEWDKELQKKAASDPEGHHMRRALLSNTVSTAIEAEKGHKLRSAGKAWMHEAGQSLKGLAAGGAAGAGVGAALGGLKGGRAGAMHGALAGGSLGANVGAVVGKIKGTHDAEASRLHGEHSKNKTAGISLGGLAGAAKAAVPAIAGAAKAGGNMLGTAMKAGGLPQVAKSVGNVATGFAKANPLAAAGAAGAAGLAVGRLSKGNGQPQA